MMHYDSFQIEINNHVSYLNPSDKHKCNWMMFVKPASLPSEQNVAVFQQTDNIYFVSTTSILYNQELRFGYALAYGNRHGIDDKLLVVSDSGKFIHIHPNRRSWYFCHC